MAGLLPRKASQAVILLCFTGVTFAFLGDPCCDDSTCTGPGEGCDKNWPDSHGQGMCDLVTNFIQTDREGAFATNWGSCLETPKDKDHDWCNNEGEACESVFDCCPSAASSSIQKCCKNSICGFGEVACRN